MAKDDRDVLRVLKSELEFLESGGYRCCVGSARRAQFIFEDSPMCMNFNSLGHPRPCSECVLTQFVPAESRAEKIPCRHIRLNEAGETMDSLYRFGTQEEIEHALRTWLWTTILWLEEERRAVEISTRRRATGGALPVGAK